MVWCAPWHAMCFSRRLAGPIGPALSLRPQRYMVYSHLTRRRRGSSTIESILVLLVLLIASLAAVQFGVALIVKQAAEHATTVAAREAAKGADVDDLVEVVDRVLEGHRIAIGSDATVVLEDGPSPTESRGELDCDPPSEPEIDSDEVRVTLCVSLTARPFLNILKCYGIDFRGHTFQSSAVATKE